MSACRRAIESEKRSAGKIDLSSQKKSNYLNKKGSCFDSMGSKLRTISLDGETSKIADRIENFSGWVRAQLLKLDEHKNRKIDLIFQCSKCNTRMMGNLKMNFKEHYLVDKDSTCDGIMELE